MALISNESSLSRDSSWIITDNVTGYRFETFSERNRDMAMASPRYTVEGIGAYLGRLNADIRARKAYEADCAAFPTYHDGKRRPPWESLSADARAVWARTETS